jgi:hypothetical protein
MLLPAGSEEQIAAGFVGTLGAFEIYRGAPRGRRMANLRVILRLIERRPNPTTAIVNISTLMPSCKLAGRLPR